MRHQGAAAVTMLLCLSVCHCQSQDGKPSPTRSGPVNTTPAPTGNATVQGTVKFSGTMPPPEPWGGASNADCQGKHEPTISLVKASNGMLEDAFVYIKAGLPAGTYPTLDKPITLDQKGCEYIPRVFGIMMDQPIDILNSDSRMHNVNAGVFNQGSPGGSKFTKSLPDEAVMQVFKCDVHPWMRAYAGVMSHPYFQVTKSDGRFELKGLVDGEYTVVAWHEKLGTLEKHATASAATPATVEFEYVAK